MGSSKRVLKSSALALHLNWEIYIYIISIGQVSVKYRSSIDSAVECRSSAEAYWVSADMSTDCRSSDIDHQYQPTVSRGWLKWTRSINLTPSYRFIVPGTVPNKVSPNTKTKHTTVKADQNQCSVLYRVQTLPGFSAWARSPISWKFKNKKILDLSCFLCAFINWVWFLGESGEFLFLLVKIRKSLKITHSHPEITQFKIKTVTRIKMSSISLIFLLFSNFQLVGVPVVNVGF